MILIIILIIWIVQNDYKLWHQAKTAYYCITHDVTSYKELCIDGFTPKLHAKDIISQRIGNFYVQTTSTVLHTYKTYHICWKVKGRGRGWGRLMRKGYKKDEEEGGINKGGKKMKERNTMEGWEMWKQKWGKRKKK
jgi:hypothetical protein